MIFLITNFGPHNFSLPIKLVDFLRYIEEGLRAKEFENVKKIIIVDYGIVGYGFENCAINESELKCFTAWPQEDWPLPVTNQIEKIINEAKVIKKDQLKDPEFWKELNGNKILFHTQFFPKEFIEIYNSLDVSERILISDGNPVKEPELYFSQVEHLHSIFSELICGNTRKKYFQKLFYEINIKNGNADLYAKSKRYESLFGGFISEVFELIEKNRVLNFRIEQTYLNNCDYIWDYIERSLKDSDELKNLFEEQIYLLGSLEFLNDSKYPSFLSSIRELTEKEYEEKKYAFEAKYYDSVRKYLSFDKFVQLLSQTGESHRIIIKSFFPEFLYKILDEENVYYFNQLRTSNSEYYLVDCDDREFAGYLVGDALRDKEYYIYNALDPWGEVAQKYNYLIINNIDALSKKHQIEVWESIRKFKSLFSSIIIVAPADNISASILEYFKSSRIRVGKFEKLNIGKVKTFFYLLNKKTPINKKAPEIELIIPFYMGQLNSYFDNIESFMVLDEFIKNMDDFIYYELLWPIFWYELSLALNKNKRLKHKDGKVLKTPKRYYVKYKNGKWEISYGYCDTIIVDNTKGFKYLFFTLYHKDHEFTPLELYQRFTSPNEKGTSRDNEEALVEITTAKNRALKDLMRAEEERGVGNEFSTILRANFENGYDQKENRYITKMSKIKPSPVVYVPEEYMKLKT